MRASVGHLSKGVAIYGAGDAATQVIRIVLTAVYVKYGFLGTRDYGGLGLILSIEMIVKVISRWGLDGAFMRFYHDRPVGGPLERLTSTIVWFTLTADVMVFAALALASGWLGGKLFDDNVYMPALRLMLVNTLLISLTYIPFHLMRLRNQAATYSGLVFARSIGTVALQPVFVMWLGWGVTGLFAADLAVTIALLPVLWPWLRPLLQRTFATDELRAVLRFGLPRLPHGLAQQALDAGNKLLLRSYVPLDLQGVYQNGTTLGTGVRFFTSSFETAWAPFYYATAKQPDAKTVFSKMATYGVAALTLIVAVTIAVARDAILLFLRPEYLAAVPVVPIIAVGIAMQGIYLLTSIGLNLTRRTELYPIATFAALAVGLGSGVVLMPQFGITGAAMSFLASTLTQTTVAFLLSRSQYPITYEGGRLLRVVVAGAVAAIAGLWMVPEVQPLVAVIVRTLVVVAVFATLLLVTGFFRKTERAYLAEIIDKLRRRSSVPLRDANVE